MGNSTTPSCRDARFRSTDGCHDGNPPAPGALTINTWPTKPAIDITCIEAVEHNYGHVYPVMTCDCHADLWVCDCHNLVWHEDDITPVDTEFHCPLAGGAR